MGTTGLTDVSLERDASNVLKPKYVANKPAKIFITDEEHVPTTLSHELGHAYADITMADQVFRFEIDYEKNKDPNKKYPPSHEQYGQHPNIVKNPSGVTADKFEQKVGEKIKSKHTPGNFKRPKEYQK